MARSKFDFMDLIIILADNNGNAVILADCQIKRARYGDEFEVCIAKKLAIQLAIQLVTCQVLVTKNTTVEKLERKYNIPTGSADDIQKDHIAKPAFWYTTLARVTWEAKVLKVDEITKTGSR